MPETIETLAALVIAVLPGALHVWAVEREVGRWGVGLSDRLLRFIGTTALYQAVFAFPVYLVWTRVLHDQVSTDGDGAFVNHLASGTAPGWFWLVPVGYVALPILVGTLAAFSVNRWPRLSRILLGRNPAPTSWETLFTRQRGGIIRGRLKSDGRWVGGFFGPESYAAGYGEEPQDLLIERAYHLLDDGSFAEGESEGGYVELGSALLVRWEELDQLEFFPSEVR